MSPFGRVIISRLSAFGWQTTVSCLLYISTNLLGTSDIRFWDIDYIEKFDIILTKLVIANNPLTC